MMPNLRDLALRIYYAPADDPLHNFYIPALSASLRYDRAAGYFSSSALAVAAAGVAHLIQNGGRMRLLAGAQLSQEDVEAIRRGHDLAGLLEQSLLQRFPEPQDALLRQRLEVLAWMVASGALEIKVVLQKDEAGLPVPYQPGADYYHPKTGIFTDAQGNQVGFNGSINETESGWAGNYENFLVVNSWDTPLHVRQLVHNFEALWDGKESGWIAVPVPAAVRQRLLQFRPASAPARDPLEAPRHAPAGGIDLDRERVLLQYLRDAPRLLGAAGLGAATSAITPWPHQARVAQSAVERFPARLMLCDEVGLGKTIEAGLILRQLLLEGQVQRCLILAPKSVVKQWQEELFEKFALRVPVYDGSRFWDLYGLPLAGPPGNPWDAYPLLIAGSQLAKRADRHSQVLSARGWDLVLVDEAHHARRKDFKERIYRPNRLLTLLNDLVAREKTAGLVLMTATPMQVHPLEVWDLLKLLGLGARWGADEENFLQFFSELQKDYKHADWDFILDMLEDALQTGGSLDPAFVQQAETEAGLVQWAQIRALPGLNAPRGPALRALRPEGRVILHEMARRHTPLRQFVFRSTRTLLREYQRQGILKANVPTRKPRIERVPMQPEEHRLYERIDEYITHFYQKYERERRGTGFIMTVYRRRLTSSFYAVRCSLERRLRYLRGEMEYERVYDDDDLEQEELALDLSEEQPAPDDLRRFQAEVEYLRDFLTDLRSLSINDSKLERLKGELRQVFHTRPTVLIFTQYTDTMDYLRDQLREVYGSQVACYSGRGGEVWNGLAWVVTTKEKVKTDFKEARTSILLCTESASEGLNLQTCGVLINYDMPWNPMRVEQRIGRIDRIGQEFPQVWISNYFYQETIEDVIYQRLSDRINWFEVVVGELQPILAEVGEVTRRLAMLPAEQRAARLDEEINALRLRIQNREVEALNLDQFTADGQIQAGPPSPLSMQDLESILVYSPLTSGRFNPHPSLERVYILTLHDRQIPVTFDPTAYDAHASAVEFLTYANPLLDELLQATNLPASLENPGLLRLTAPVGPEEAQPCAWYALEPGARDPVPVSTLDQLRRVLESHVPLTEETIAAARRHYQAQVESSKQRQQEVLRVRRLGSYLAELSRARSLLLKAALVEIALGQRPELLDRATYPSAFSESAVTGLQRHRYPWQALLSLAYESDLTPHETDPYFQGIKSDRRESLQGRFKQLTDQARHLVYTLAEAKKALEGDSQE